MSCNQCSFFKRNILHRFHATPTSEFCAPVAARLNVNLEQDVDFCPGSSKSQDANLAGMLRVRPNVGYGERILASASS